MHFSLSSQVDAYPPVVTFSWFFNNSEHREALEDTRFTSNGLVSTLDFTPTNTQDYGTLFCQGENIIGHQVEPCAFQIVPTGESEILGVTAFLFFSFVLFSGVCSGVFFSRRNIDSH